MNSLYQSVRRLYEGLAVGANYLQAPLMLFLRLYFFWQLFLAGKGKLLNIERTAEFFGSLNIPMPLVNAYLAGATECFGGLLLVVGLASRAVAIPVAFMMIVAYVTADSEALMSIFSDPDKFVAAAPFPFLLTALLVLAFGPGTLSLDALIKRMAPRERFGAMFLRVILLLAVVSLQSGRARAEEAVEWHPWSEAVLERAKKENRFVLLDLGAVWCHWCHVMEEVTYRDPKVIELIRSRYIGVRVDQDSRPDLANRYEDYGWPATIVFAPDGTEIVKRQGYIPPRPMASMLQAIIDDPTPGPSILPEEQVIPASEASLSAESREALRARLLDAYDPQNLGWGTSHKFLDWDIVEYCMSLKAGDEKKAAFERMARETLGAQRQLIDSTWGGVYQYSTDGDWSHPHYEKLLQFQAENLRVYSAAYARWGDPEYLENAIRIRGYMKSFLTSPEGAFYTSQDADLVPGEHSADYFALDDAGRREKGIPRVDTHAYSRENGWAIQALAALYAVTGEREYLDDALRAANWIIGQRSLPGGGFSHGETDSAGPYLGDTLTMGAAFLALYAATAESAWLNRAISAAQFIDANFKSDSGYATLRDRSSQRPPLQIDENTSLARFANLLGHYSGQDDYRRMAEHAMRYAAAPAIGQRRGFHVGGILLADRELSSPPLHITIVGAKNDPAARSLFLAALRQPATYKRVEWLDESEGPLLNADVEYPRVDRAAAFLCTDKSCSPPIFAAEKLRVR